MVRQHGVARRTVRVECRHHGDADPQPGVAVDDVVAAAAFDDVAAGAAEQDVAADEPALGVERGRSRAGKQRLQARDEGDALGVERAAAEAFRGHVGRGHVRTADDVVMCRTRSALDLGEAVERGIGRKHRNTRQNLGVEVDIDGEFHAVVGRPVVAGHAVELAAAEAAEPDVVAAFADELVEAAVAVEHVVSLDRVELELIVEVVADGAGPGADFDPVVALPAHRLFGGLAAVDEVVADAAEGLVQTVRAEDDEVLAFVGDHQVDALAGVDRVVAAAGAHDVVAEQVGDDVVAVAADVLVVAGAAFHAVVAAVAVEGVVALAGDEGVVLVGAAQQDVVGAGVAQVVRLNSGGRRIVAHDQRGEDAAADRIGPEKPRVPLLALVDLEDEAGRGEHVRGQMAGVGIEADHLGEGVVLHFGEQMQAVEPLQVVEAVAVLELFELDFEHEVEGRAQHAAERHDLFGEAADPEVDVVEAAQRAAGVDAGGVEEGHAVGIEGRERRRFGRNDGVAEAGAEDQRHGRVALAFDRGLGGDQRVRSVGGDEVDDRGFVLEVAREVDPARVGPQFLGVAAGLEEVAARGVQRRHAGIATAGQVDGGQIERQAEQVVAQGAGDELVDLVADLPRHAADDVAGGDAVGDGVARRRVELDRIEEALDEADLVVGEGRIEPVDRLGQHRVAEAIDDVRELGDDARVDVGVVAVRHDEEVDVGLHLAGEVLEHEMLVLHLGAELGGLEQAFAVPVSEGRHGSLRVGRDGVDQGGEVDIQPFVDEGHVLGARARFPWCARPAGCARSGRCGGRRSGRCSRWRGRRRR